jgi:hypothetical protein
MKRGDIEETDPKNSIVIRPRPTGHMEVASDIDEGAEVWVGEDELEGIPLETMDEEQGWHEMATSAEFKYVEI